MQDSNKHATLWIAGICVVVFIFQKLISWITNELALNSALAFYKPWTFVTAMFLHGSLVHLMFNMLALVIFGLVLEQTLGTKKFLILYFSTGIFAGLASVLFYNSVIGASGAIFGIIGALVALKPKMIVYLYGLPVPMYIAGILYAAIDLFGVFFPSNTANIAHLAGSLIGLILGLTIYKKYKEGLNKNEVLEVGEL
jgi:membrane associated rhomboid family serine protease